MRHADPPRTIPALLAAAAERFADRPAIEDGDVTLSFRELAAAGLARRARVHRPPASGRGDRVAIWAPNIHEWVVAALGIQSAGGVLVPLNTRMKGREAGYILAKSGARMLCTVEEFLGNRYVDLLRERLRRRRGDRPVADLPALERVVLLRGDAATAHATSWSRLPRRAATRCPAADARARARRPSRPTTSPTSSSPRARPGSRRAS